MKRTPVRVSERYWTCSACKGPHEDEKVARTVVVKGKVLRFCEECAEGVELVAGQDAEPEPERRSEEDVRL